MKKKQWYVFAAIFLLLFIVFEIAGSRPAIVAADIESLSDLGFWIDNKVERTVALVSILISLGCMICSDWAEK